MADCFGLAIMATQSALVYQIMQTFRLILGGMKQSG